jgi:RNA polymerase sigma-70 factor (ECF subfamily)
MLDDDARLMLAFRGGDRRAFETLFARFTPRVLSFLTRMVRDRARAEELTQDVFVRIYQAAERYEPSARFSTWIFGIAHNVALNELARAHHKRELRMPEDGPLDALDPAPGADEALAAARTHAELERALGTLPERQRAALLLRSEQGLGYEEIATTLGTSVASVKSLIHRAREALHVALGDGEAK